jgi:hypothetical protein
MAFNLSHQLHSGTRSGRHVWIELVESPDSALEAGHDASLTKLGQVVANRGLPQVERCREIADAHGFGRCGEDVKDLNASRVTERLVCQSECVGARIRQGRRDRVATAFDPAEDLHCLRSACSSYHLSILAIDRLQWDTI